MTVVKQYNPATLAWDTIVVGREGDWATAQGLNTQTSDYSLVTADAGLIVTLSSGSDLTVTVNDSLNLAAGQRVDLLRLGTGEVTVVASSTVVNATPGLKLRARYSSATLLCLAADTYVLLGDLKV